jgi:CubicO group peptidase (beta-lactamase class C family)
MRPRFAVPSLAAAVAVLALAAGRPAAAQATPPDSTVQRWITERVANGYATGIVVGRRDGGRDRIVAAGGAQRDGRPVGGESIFEIGSITKVFTNILLADMVLKGEVSLDDPVQKYLPAGVTMPSRNGKAITLLDLATASSGLPSLGNNMTPKDGRNPYADYSVQQMYDFLSSHTLRRDPGERYEYSNIGMGLLGHVLGLRAGKSYEALLRERVLEPLGMRETFIEVPAAVAGRFAVPHDADLEEASPWDLPTLAGAGALRSTTRDMLKFADAVTHRDRGPLAKAIAFSIEPRRPTTIPNMRIALGWHVREVGGRTIVWHNGGTGGFRTFFGFDAATGAHAMVWSNTSNSVDDLGLHLIDSTVPRMPTPARAEVSVPAETLRGYVGSYALAPGFVIAVTEERGRLFAQPTGQPRFRLWPESPSSFYLRAVPAKVQFAADSSGTMVLTLDQGGRQQKARRQ